MLVDWTIHIWTIAMGFGTVLFVLLLLWGCCFFIKFFFGMFAVKNYGASRPEKIAIKADGIPRYHVLAVSAAVGVLMEGPHRIIEIKVPSHDLPNWSLNGRFNNIGVSSIFWGREKLFTSGSQRRKIK